MVKDLLAKGADKDEKNNQGNTPLIVTIIKNHLNVVQFLVEQGADMEKVDNNGATALMNAAAGGDGVVRYLVEQGADKEKIDNEGWTPLIYAAQDGHVMVMQYLIEQGKKLVQLLCRGQSMRVILGQWSSFWRMAWTSPRLT